MASMGALVTVEARPEPLTVDLTRSAVIVVDMQNDFGSEGGMFARSGVDISGIRAAVAPTARILAAARRAGVKVVYLKMGFRPDLSDAGAPDAPSQLKHAGLRFGETVKAPDGKESRILIRDTWNTDILDELTPERGDKRRIREQKEESLKRGKPWDDSAYLFATRTGKPLDIANAARAFKRVLRAMTPGGQEPPRHSLYDLRHTFATLLLAGSADSPPAPITYVAAQMGHATPATTLRFYARWIPRQGRRYIEGLLAVRPEGDEATAVQGRSS